MSLRPQTIRADTLDLQDSETPSAKDHTRQPIPHPNALGAGPAAPHQEAELQHLAHDRQIEEHQLVDAYGSDRYGYDDARDSNTTDIRSRAGTPYQDGAGQNGHEDGNMQDVEGGDDMEDDMMDDKISSSPSIDEDVINFDFVYALHTFIATVEGQANASKGDTMVLLDDSNSYWWLVRIIKDNSIGYLPAEHIETPTERLARLNKHKNIDLSATMLGDTAEKSKNPLKKAMRRRNAKTVTFNPPTYYEATEIDWSDTEAENEGKVPVNGNAESRRNGGQLDRARANGSAKNGMNGTLDGQAAAVASVVANVAPTNGISTREAAAIRSRNIEIRHTDSFLNDSSIEPKKISLTPDILREDANGSARSSESSQAGDVVNDLRPVSPSSERARKDARAKDKKPGMLSGLFKRKEKNIKIDKVAGATPVKSAAENSSPAQSPAESGRSSPSLLSLQQSSPTAKRQAANSKLVKNPPPSTATPAASILKPQSPPQEKILSLRTRPSNTNMTKSTSPTELRTTSALGRAMSPEPQYERVASPEPDRVRSPEPERMASPEPLHERIMSPEPPERVLSPEPNMPSGAATLASRNAFATQTFGPMAPPMAPPSRAPPAPSPRNAPPATPGSVIPQEQQQHQQPQLRVNTQQNGGYNAMNERGIVAMSPTGGEAPGKLSIDSITTPSLANTSSTDTLGTSGQPPQAPIYSTPQNKLMAADSRIAESSAAAKEAPSDIPENNEPTFEWDDHALLTYLDDSSTNDVRDLLLIVQDPIGVVPLPPDHPEMLELGFADQRKKLDAMENELDALLAGFLARREGRIL